MNRFYRLAPHCLFLFALWLFYTSTAYANFPGEIAFVGFNADGDDGLSFVLLTGSEPNATVYFTDRQWDGSAFTGGEGTLTWDAPNSALPAGTIVTFENINGTQTISHGSISESGTFNIGGSNEILYAYQGTDSDTPSVFFAAIANEEYDSMEATLGYDPLQNTGLISDTTAVQIDLDEDVMVYSGTTSFTNEASALAAIGNSSNWDTDDGTGDQNLEPDPPNFPDDVISSMTIAAPTAVTVSQMKAQTARSHHIALIIILIFQIFTVWWFYRLPRPNLTR